MKEKLITSWNQTYSHMYTWLKNALCNLLNLIIKYFPNLPADIALSQNFV